MEGIRKDFLYFETNKRKGLVFTEHCIDERRPYKAMKGVGVSAVPICPPEGPPYWSRKSGRYRTQKEQSEYLRRGCIDVQLPPLEV